MYRLALCDPRILDENYLDVAAVMYQRPTPQAIVDELNRSQADFGLLLHYIIFEPDGEDIRNAKVVPSCQTVRWDQETGLYSLGDELGEKEIVFFY